VQYKWKNSTFLLIFTYCTFSGTQCENDISCELLSFNVTSYILKIYYSNKSLFMAEKHKNDTRKYKKLKTWVHIIIVM